MITNPSKVIEQIQNEIAAKLGAAQPFDTLKFPDGSDFQILTEDEGEPEMLYTAQIALCGLSVIVDSPTGKFKRDPGNNSVLKFAPFVIGIGIGEYVLYNRDPNGIGTKLRASTVAEIVLCTLNGFVPPTLGQPIFATMLRKGTDTMPRMDKSESDLVVVRQVTFEATEARVDLT